MSRPTLISVRRKTGTILFLFGAFLAVGTLATLFRSPRVYEAVSRLQIDPLPPAGCTVAGGGSWTLTKVPGLGQEDPSYFPTATENLRSRPLLKQVIHSLKLERDLRYEMKLDIVRALRDDITVLPLPLTRLVDIKVRHSNPIMAANIANTVASTFSERSMAWRQRGAMDRLQQLKMEADNDRSRLLHAEQVLAKYQNEKKFSPATGDYHAVVQVMRQAQRSYSEAQSRSQLASNTLVALERHTQNGHPPTTFSAVASDRRVEEAQMEAARIEIELAASQAPNGENEPTSEKIQKQLKVARTLLERATENRIETLKSEAELALATERHEADKVQALERRTAEWNEANIQYELLRVEAATLREALGRTLNDMHELERASDDRINNIQVVAQADMPLKPVSPRVVVCFQWFMAGIGLIVMGWRIRRTDLPMGASGKFREAAVEDLESDPN